MILKEDRRRKREAGNEETRKRGRASRYLFPGRAWKQGAEPENKEAEPGREQGMQSAHDADFV